MDRFKQILLAIEQVAAVVPIPQVQLAGIALTALSNILKAEHDRGGMTPEQTLAHASVQLDADIKELLADIAKGE